MTSKSHIETEFKRLKNQLKKKEKILHNYNMQAQILGHKINEEKTHITIIREQMESLCVNI